MNEFIKKMFAYGVELDKTEHRFEMAIIINDAQILYRNEFPKAEPISHPHNWNDLTIVQRLALVDNNTGLKKYTSLHADKLYAEKAFVREKTNGVIRFITKNNEHSETFTDDGKISGASPSPSCHYEYYIMI